MSIESTNKQQVTYTNEQVELIKRTICEGATNDELALFMNQCKRTGLDPFSKQIYAIKRKAKDKDGKYVEKFSHQVAIDGLRVIADRTGKYAGQLPSLWCGEDGKWVDIWLQKTPPLAAKVSVLRSDFKEPITAVARFDSYAQKYDGNASGLWKTMPDVMLAKCAEALAMRKAFPSDMSGLHTEDEMGQADNIETQDRISEARIKDVQIDVKDTTAMHLELIEQSTNKDILKNNYMKAVAFARSQNNKDLEKIFTELKDVIKESLKEEPAE